MVAGRKDDAAPPGLMPLAHRMGEGGRRPGEGFSFGLGFYKDAAPDGAGDGGGVGAENPKGISSFSPALTRSGYAG